MDLSAAAHSSVFSVALHSSANILKSDGGWQYDRKKGVAFRVDEYYHDGRRTLKQLTDEEYYEKLVNLAQGKNVRSVIVDPSAASFIAVIRKHGRFNVRKADNRVLSGIRFVCELLNSGRLKFSSKCTAIFDEFAGYKWDETATDDRVIKSCDHAMDEMRYFASTVIKR